MADRSAAPNTVPWPPLVALGCALAAVLLGLAVPAGGLLPDALAPAGWALAAAALGLDAWAMATMARARANILPHRAATALVTRGPFRFTRNPIYLGNALLLAGIALASGNAWFLPAAAAAALLTQRLAIVREEEHLAARFGAEWEAYRARVRRWL